MELFGFLKNISPKLYLKPEFQARKLVESDVIQMIEIDLTVGLVHWEKSKLPMNLSLDLRGLLRFLLFSISNIISKSLWKVNFDDWFFFYNFG